MVFFKTLTSEVLRHEFCRIIPCCRTWDAKGKREAKKMNDVQGEDGIPEVEEENALVGTAGASLEDSAAPKDTSKCRDIILILHVLKGNCILHTSSFTNFCITLEAWN